MCHTSMQTEIILNTNSVSLGKESENILVMNWEKDKERLRKGLKKLFDP